MADPLPGSDPGGRSAFLFEKENKNNYRCITESNRNSTVQPGPDPRSLGRGSPADGHPGLGSLPGTDARSCGKPTESGRHPGQPDDSRPGMDIRPGNAHCLPGGRRLALDDHSATLTAQRAPGSQDERASAQTVVVANPYCTSWTLPRSRPMARP